MLFMFSKQTCSLPNSACPFFFHHGADAEKLAGHVAKDFDVPQARTIVQRGMLWAAGSLVEKN